MRVVVDLRSEYEFWAFGARHRAELAEQFPATQFAAAEKEFGPADLDGAEVYFGWRFPAEAFAWSPGMRWMASPAAGVDHLPVAEAAARGVMVTRGVGYHGAPMAEHVMGLVFGFARGLFLSVRRQREQRWWKDEIAGDFFDVAGSTMAVVGCGAVGQEVARLARSAGMRVLGVRRRTPSTDTPHIDRWFSGDRVAEALAAADVVINLLPATCTTEGFFDRDRFAAMRAGAVFINVGRGATVHEPALLQALESGRVAWCGLDVTVTKPPSMQDPLRHHPRVVLTPKSAVFSRRYMDEAVRFFAGNLRRYLDGEPLRGLVISEEVRVPHAVVDRSS